MALLCAISGITWLLTVITMYVLCNTLLDNIEKRGDAVLAMIFLTVHVTSAVAILLWKWSIGR